MTRRRDFDGWPNDLSGKRVLVINPLRAYWSMGFCAEAALRARHDGAEVTWFDAPRAIGRGAERLQANSGDRWRSLLFRDPLPTMRNELRRAGVRISDEARYSKIANTQRGENTPSFTSLTELGRWTEFGMPLGACVHASVSGELHIKHLDLAESSVHQRVAEQCRIAIFLGATYRRLIDAEKPDVVLTTNDRVLPAAVAVLAADAAGVEQCVVYWGSTSTRTATYRRSLYAHSAWRELVELNAERLVTQNTLESKGAEALAALRDTDTDVFSPHDFRNKMRGGNVPARSKPKRAVVFAGTPWEFSAAANEEPGRFKDQQEAVGALLTLLEPDEWEVVLRHHPSHPQLGDLSERWSWSGILEKPNVVEIGADSSVDSFELANDADLNVVWTSTIGVRLLARRLPTLVCGPAYWAKDEWGISGRSRDGMSRALQHPARTIADSELWPVLAFMGEFGSELQYTSNYGQRSLDVRGKPVIVHRLPARAARRARGLFRR